MKFRNIIWLSAFFLFACESKHPANEVKSIKQHHIEKPSKTDNTEVISEPEVKTSKVAVDPVSRTKAFFDWYKNNRTEFYALQAACVSINAEDYYVVDSNRVITYINYLSNTGFFGKTFTSEVKKNWFGYCANEMEKDMKEGLTADGPPNCVYEGDIIFKVQEDPSPNMYENIDYQLVEIDSNTQEVKTNSAIFVWQLEGLNWMIKDLF